LKQCSNCKTELDDKVTKCPECKKSICAKCGQVLGDAVTKCPQCGQPTKMGGIQSLGCMLLFGGVFMIVLVVIALVAC
jgi:RNA polymerase subunit RPABC4/transcription elongation factor Spt4